MKRQIFWGWFVCGLMIALLWLLPFSLPVKATSGDANSSQSFEELVANTWENQGIFTLYENPKEGKFLLEVKEDQLNKDYLCIASLASGLGEGFFINGFALNSLVFQFKKVENKLLFVVPNLNFRVKPGDPLSTSLARSFSDSVLYSLPIQATRSDGSGFVIDLKKFFLENQDLAGLQSFLGGLYLMDGEKSFIKETNVFPENLEIETLYGFNLNSRSGVSVDIPAVPDSRSFNLSIHYSFSELPKNNGYQPRLADDRIGYFINAYKDLSNTTSKEPFVRYIKRWRLEPSDPTLPISPPKKPIVFWLENTIPLEYREVIKEGVLMWNNAFEKAGFKDAIVVEQMPDNADWDPGDIRYNTVRWASTSDSGILGYGPSHTNPLTGEILDADLVINGNVIRYLQEQYSHLSSLNQPQGLATKGLISCQKGIGFTQYWGVKSQDWLQENKESYFPGFESFSEGLEDSDFCYSAAAKEQFSLGILSMSLLQNDLPSSEETQKYVKQYLRYLVAHEVGHTLGLRHNFHGSTLLKPEELNNTNITQTKGLVNSVMDYVGVNLAPSGVEQGDYFPTIIGPYDQWAIEYGYKFSGALIPEAEQRFLEKIAQRAPEKELAYATDEDLFGFQDPQVNAFDLSDNPLQYAQGQLDNALLMWNRLEKRYPVRGDRYSDIRTKFNEVFDYYVRQLFFISHYIGGRSFNRDHPGDPQGRLPFEQVPLEQQRQSLALLEKYLFSAEALNFSPKLLNELAPSRWDHWGHPAPLFALDYPIHDQILWLQRGMLRSLLSNWRLSDLRDLELKAPPEEALTLPELYQTLTTGIWSEVLEAKDNGINISSIRRSLQREHLKILGDILLGRQRAPEDGRTLAGYQLRQLEKELDRVLDRFENQLDNYTKAHLIETRDRVGKILDAEYALKKQTPSRA